MGHEYGTVEKIFCCDRGDNDALIATLANRRDNDGMLPALLMNGNNQQWNNPFIYMVWMMFAQRMWGNDWNDAYNNPNTAQNIETKPAGLFAFTDARQPEHKRFDGCNQRCRM